MQRVSPLPPRVCTVVWVVASFLMNLVLIHTQKRHPLHGHPFTLFPKSPFIWVVGHFGIMHVSIIAMDSSIVVSHASLDSMFYVVQSQTSLPTMVMSTNFFSLALYLNKNAVVMILKVSQYFREFAIDFKCVTLSKIRMYKQHKHSFTLCYTAEDDSEEYYCGIYEEKRDLKHWFYYCANCNYLAHTKCILSKNPNLK